MIKDFLRFVYESKYDSFSEEIANTLMKLITSKKAEAFKGRIARTIEYVDPATFLLTITVARSKTFEPSKSRTFYSVPWEKENFNKNGFAIDARSYIFYEDHAPDPEIEINIVIDPSKEPESHKLLYFRLLDCVRHELEHLLQKGQNKQKNHSGPEVDKNRKDSESSYKYFLLPDEIPAMVSGMRLSSDKKGIPVDVEFETYLSPIKDSGLITAEEMEEVIDRWVKFTVKHFPETKISKKYRIL